MVGLSRRDALLWSLPVLLFSLISGWLVWGPVRRAPLAALHEAELALNEHQNSLEDLVSRRTEELQGALRRAEAASLAKSQFLSSMSHELRTPLNAVLGFAQMLEYDSALNAEQQDSVKEILHAGRHLLDLINDVLDLARIESGRVTLTLTMVDLAELCEECRVLTQPIAHDADIDLRTAIEYPGVVWADRVRLKQVVLNLLSNAIKYNHPGGRVCLLATVGEPGYCRLAVEDTGRGIAPERIGDLFQPFNRLGAESGSIEGTGIGLNITRRLVIMMDGEISVTSTPGVGSVFRVDVPVGPPENVGAGDTAPTAAP
jgi:signal transduction histidine kinase